MSPPSIDVTGVTDTTAVTIPDPLTVNNFSARRARAGKLNGGVCAFASSDFFKDRDSVAGKRKARRWDHRLSAESRARKPSSLKANSRYLKTPGLISLGAGLPSSAYFPIESVAVKVPVAPHFSEEETRESGVLLHAGKHDVSEGKGAFDIEIALNYGQGTGSAQMLRFVTEHTEIVHNPPYQDWGCCLTVGNTSALDIALRMFTERGDYLLCEEYMFSSAIESAGPLGLKLVGIKMDEQGLLPEHLDALLCDWDAGAKKKPAVLYTVPSGQNPTGATQSADRRRAIYAVAQKHDLYILEDEPYYFLQMAPYTAAAGASPSPSSPPPPPSEETSSSPLTHEAFLAALVPSLLSMDVDGRVLRLDSFSKVVAPGSRTGWVTGSDQVVERFVRHNEVSVQTPSGFAQLVLFKLLDEHWGHAGYLDWLIHLRLQYTRRRDVMLRACERFLPREVVRWTPPAAGMFLWLQILPPPSTSASASPSPSEIEDAIFNACIQAGVLVVRGSMFRAESDVVAATEPDPDAKPKATTKPAELGDVGGSNKAGGGGAEHDGHKSTDAQKIFFRATFAAAEPGLMTEAIRRLGEAVRGVFSLEG